MSANASLARGNEKHSHCFATGYRLSSTGAAGIHQLPSTVTELLDFLV
jgi:hypothetical protein